jgi:cell division protein FtsX
MSHQWLKNKNTVNEARDRAAQDERAQVRGLLSADSSTRTNRSISDETKLKQLEENSYQPKEKAESSLLSPDSSHLIAYRSEKSKVEAEERAFRLSN